MAWDKKPNTPTFHASAVTEVRPQEVIHVNNVKVKALIDSGADVCLMDAGYLDNMCPENNHARQTRIMPRRQE